MNNTQQKDTKLTRAARILLDLPFAVDSLSFTQWTHKLVFQFCLFTVNPVPNPNCKARSHNLYCCTQTTFDINVLPACGQFLIAVGSLQTEILLEIFRLCAIQMISCRDWWPWTKPGYITMTRREGKINGGRHSDSPRPSTKNSECKYKLEMFSPHFFGIKTLSSSLIILQRTEQENPVQPYLLIKL